MANLTGEQYGGGSSRSSFLRKDVKISRLLLQKWDMKARKELGKALLKLSLPS
jgi:hypothetical protein